MSNFEFLIPIVFFTSVAIVIYYIVKFRNSERLAVIEKGMSEEQLNYFKITKKYRFLTHETTLKLSVLLIGVGLAILTGNFVPDDMKEATIGGLVFVLPGLGLLWVYKHLQNKTESKEDI